MMLIHDTLDATLNQDDAISLYIRPAGVVRRITAASMAGHITSRMECMNFAVLAHLGQPC